MISFEHNFPKIGILGGGQLAKMLSQPAARLGIETKCMVKRTGDALPGLRGGARTGDWDDPAQALEFAKSVDIVTLENEFVNQESLYLVEQQGIKVIPSLASIRLIQDKWRQKEAMMRAGLPVVPSRPVESKADAKAFADEHGWPIVLKRRHFGYDGKGNATVRDVNSLDSAWQQLSVNEAGLYAEAFCPFEKELAVMVCRSVTGETAVYPVVDTVQEHHICKTVHAPSSLPEHVVERAGNTALAAIEAIDGQGTMGVELFLTKDGHVLVNELAPRVHNSGHYTIEACHCSQFENHIRAITGLPLGSTAMIKPCAVMINLIGEHDGPAVPEGYGDALRVDGAFVHIYGKETSRKGRKMGHVTALGDTAEEAGETAARAAGCIRFGTP